MLDINSFDLRSSTVVLPAYLTFFRLSKHNAATTMLRCRRFSWLKLVYAHVYGQLGCVARIWWYIYHNKRWIIQCILKTQTSLIINTCSSIIRYSWSTDITSHALSFSTKNTLIINSSIQTKQQQKYINCF